MFRIAAALLALLVWAVPASAQDKTQKEHRLVIQVSENDAGKMNLALNNAVNVSKFYAAKGKEVKIEIVAFGPGLHIFRDDSSPVRQRLLSFQKSMPEVSLTACGNTIHTMEKASGKKIALIAGDIRVVEAGVTRIMELQEEGYSYVRP